MRIAVPKLLRTYPIISVVAVCTLVIILTYIFATSLKQPWESGGRLVVAVRAVPGDTSETTLGLGIDDMMLIERDGDDRKASMRTKRITLKPGSEQLEVLFDMTAPVGEYSGFSFSLKSPELKNNWQEEVSPTPISLGGEFIQLAAPFRVQKDTTSVIILSFETLQALYDKDGADIYLPVIQTETRLGAGVNVDEQGLLFVEGGVIDHSATYGMGWDGVMRYNVRAPRDQNATEGTEPYVQEVTDTVVQESASSTDVSTSTEEEVGNIENTEDGAEPAPEE